MGVSYALRDRAKILEPLHSYETLEIQAFQRHRAFAFTQRFRQDP